MLNSIPCGSFPYSVRHNASTSAGVMWCDTARDSGLRLHECPGDRVRAVRHGGIHEYHNVEPANRLGDIHFELVCDLEFNIRQTERRQPLDNKPTDSVVATAQLPYPITKISLVTSLWSGISFDELRTGSAVTKPQSALRPCYTHLPSSCWSLLAVYCRQSSRRRHKLQ